MKVKFTVAIRLHKVYSSPISLGVLVFLHLIKYVQDTKVSNVYNFSVKDIKLIPNV